MDDFPSLPFRSTGALYWGKNPPQKKEEQLMLSLDELYTPKKLNHWTTTRLTQAKGTADLEQIKGEREHLIEFMKDELVEFGVHTKEGAEKRFAATKGFNVERRAKNLKKDLHLASIDATEPSPRRKYPSSKLLPKTTVPSPSKKGVPPKSLLDLSFLWS